LGCESLSRSRGQHRSAATDQDRGLPRRPSGCRRQRSTYRASPRADSRIRSTGPRSTRAESVGGQRIVPPAAAYWQARENLREVGVDDPDLRYIICHHPEQADRDRTQREDAIAGLQTELDRIAKARKTPSNQQSHRETQGADRHTKIECALRDHPAS
jgi:hypothetical protein